MLRLVVRHIVYILRYREKGIAMILSAVSIAARFDEERSSDRKAIEKTRVGKFEKWLNGS